MPVCPTFYIRNLLSRELFSVFYHIFQNLSTLIEKISHFQPFLLYMSLVKKLRISCNKTVKKERSPEFFKHGASHRFQI